MLSTNSLNRQNDFSWVVQHFFTTKPSTVEIKDNQAKEASAIALPYIGYAEGKRSDQGYFC